MKTKTTFRSLFVLLGLVFASYTNAQTINFLGFTDSSFNLNCPTPTNIDFNGWGETTGLDPQTDSVVVQISFGDGTDTTFNAQMWGNMTTQQFYLWLTHTYNVAGTYYVQAIASTPNGLTDTIVHGPIIISNGCAQVSGELYLDNNSNCIFDAGDDTLKWFPLVLVDDITGDTVYYTWSNSNGMYSITVPSGNDYTISAVNNSGISTTCPSNGSYSFNLGQGASGTYDFGLECNNSQYDLWATAFGAGFVPGNNGYMYVHAGNSSCLPTSSTITLTLDPLVSYVGIWGNFPAPTVSGNTLTWTTPSLGSTSYYNWWSQFHSGFQIITDTTAAVGDTVCFTVTISPTSNDADLSNNTYSYCTPVLASYDPNMKEVSPKGIGSTGDVDPGTTFTYTVHFQNTGNYPAQNIYVLDTISDHLDLSTLEILGSSHNMEVMSLGGGKFRFQFSDIWLADSVSNEPESHGHFTYRIKAKSGLAIGTEITNTAHIFFDYNEAIVTNTTLNTIAVINGITENPEIEASIYPNPTNNILNVELTEKKDGVIAVYDLSGRLLVTAPLRNGKALINAQNLSSGLYILSFEGKHLGNFSVSK